MVILHILPAAVSLSEYFFITHHVPICFQQMEKKKQENKMRRDQLNDQYLELLEKQRLYFKTVKEFKEVRGGLGRTW